MPKFRKKPVEIEAIQWTGDIEAFRPWLDAHGALPFSIVNPYSPECSIKIKTLEGDMEAKANDWIIRGVKGEFYPCKPDIFAATYDPVPHGELYRVDTNDGRTVTVGVIPARS